MFLRLALNACSQEPLYLNLPNSWDCRSVSLLFSFGLNSFFFYGLVFGLYVCLCEGVGSTET